LSGILNKIRMAPKYLFFSIKALYELHENQERVIDYISESRDVLISLNTSERYRQSKNSFNHYGGSFFSQGDEDGYTLEILSRINLADKSFIEFGVGDGSENNTLILKAQGYRGAWVDAIENTKLGEIDSPEFHYYQNRVDSLNILQILEDFNHRLNSKPAVMSIDLDGNDYWLWKVILEAGYRPDLAIAEYNARFPIPIKWVMPEDSQHTWSGGDYFGASLQSLSNLFAKFGYTPIVCSINGSNVFFVRDEHLHKFPEKCELKSVFQDPFFIFRKTKGHNVSAKTVESILNGKSLEP
jgi:hypothetical protein